MSGCIVGWAHTKFGKHEGVELETLIVDAATGALVDAESLRSTWTRYISAISMAAS